MSSVAQNIRNLFKKTDSENSVVTTYLPLIIITVYLLMPYKPWSLPFSLATLIVLTGFLILLRDLKITLVNSVPRAEKFIFFFMLSLFIFSAIIMNGSNLSKAGLTAYVSSFGTFLFIRLTISKVKTNSIYLIFNLYLIATGLLILFEMLYGHYFFLSNFFIADYMKTKGYRFGSGFAPYASLAGGLILWPLSVMITKYSIATKSNYAHINHRWHNPCAIGIGTAALFYTLARASWVGLFFGIFILFTSLLVAREKLYNLIKVVTLVILVFFLATAIIPHSIYYNKAIGERIEMTIQSIPQIFRFTAHSTADIATEKPVYSEFSGENNSVIDASANTRVQLYKCAIFIIQKFPLWGIGIDHFPIAYQEYYNSLEPTARVNMDPRANLDAHNFILTYLVESGIIPSIPFFTFFLYFIIMGFRRGPKHESFPFLIGMVCVCIWMIFTGFVKERLFWLALATLAGLVSQKESAISGSDIIQEPLEPNYEPKKN